MIHFDSLILRVLNQHISALKARILKTALLLIIILRRWVLLCSSVRVTVSKMAALFFSPPTLLIIMFDKFKRTTEILNST